MMTPEQAVLSAILICIAGAVLTLLVSQYKTLAGWVAFLITSLTAVLIFSAVTKVLIAGPSAHADGLAIPATHLTLRLCVDGLTALFLMLAALIAVLAAFYSIAYMRHYQQYGVARYYPNFLLFLGGMYGLLSTTDMMWVFFLFWQLMTLPSYFLIRYESRQREYLRAANKYLLMMEIACLTVMTGAGMLASRGVSGGLKYDFDTVSANLPLLLSAHPGTAT